MIDLLNEIQSKVLKMVHNENSHVFDFLGTNRILSIYVLTTVFSLFIIFITIIYINPDFQSYYCDYDVPEIKYNKPFQTNLALKCAEVLPIQDQSEDSDDDVLDSDDYHSEHNFFPDVNELQVTDDFHQIYMLPPAIKPERKEQSDTADIEALTAVKMAIKFKQANQFEKARKLFQHAVVLSPNHPDVLLHYGEFLESDQDFINADHYYLKALMLRPKNSRALANRERVEPVVNKMDLTVLKRIDTKRSILVRLDKKKNKKDTALKRLKKEIYFQHIYHSVAIEGNTMSLAETRSVLETGLAVPGKSILEHNEIIGFESALRYLNQTLALKNYFIEVSDILEIHRRVLGHVDPISAGKFRKSQVFVGKHTPPVAEEVEILMEEFIQSLQTPYVTSMHPIHIAAYTHHRLVYIHPFTDGNGRTARLLMNLIFLKFGYPPIIIRKEDRSQYYKCLEMANEGDLRPFYRFIAMATEHTVDAFLSDRNGKDVIPKALESKYDVIDVIPLNS